MQTVSFNGQTYVHFVKLQDLIEAIRKDSDNQDVVDVLNELDERLNREMRKQDSVFVVEKK